MPGAVATAAMVSRTWRDAQRAQPEMIPLVGDESNARCQAEGDAGTGVLKMPIMSAKVWWKKSKAPALRLMSALTGLDMIC